MLIIVIVFSLFEYFIILLTILVRFFLVFFIRKVQQPYQLQLYLFYPNN